MKKEEPPTRSPTKRATLVEKPHRAPAPKRASMMAPSSRASGETSAKDALSSRPSQRKSTFGVFPGSKSPAPLKLTFKHDILSMQGFNPEIDKKNQDFASYHQFVAQKATVKLFLLGDGHGPQGSDASKFAVETVAKQIEDRFKALQETEPDEEIIKNIVTEAYLFTQAEMEKGGEVSGQFVKNKYAYSGTTLVLALVRKNNLLFANAGDSKAFLASKQENKVQSLLATIEHKPEDSSEKQRIEEAGGSVSPLFDSDGKPNGPHRIWNEKKTEPGLATSRTLGDVKGHTLGVSAAPGSLS